MIWVLIAIAAVALVAVWLTVARRPHQESGVESFRRHIDALSPEARREVINRVRPPQNDNGGNSPDTTDGPER